MKKYVILLVLWAGVSFAGMPDGHNGHKWLTPKEKIPNMINCVPHPNGTLTCSVFEKWKGYDTSIDYLFDKGKLFGVIISFADSNKGFGGLGDKVINDFGKPIHYAQEGILYWNKDGTRIEWYYMKNEMYILHNETITRLMKKQ